MPTFCSICGSTLAEDVNFCPKCGTSTPSYYSHSSSSQLDPTEISSSADATQQKVPTDYGSPPYGMPDKNSYDLLNPYGTIPPPPPPPRRVRSSLAVGIISGIVVSILILGVVGTFAFLTLKRGSTPTGTISL